MGAIVDETQLGRVLGYIEAGKEQGAGLHLGGSRVLEDTGGFFVEPTIFDAVSNDMTIAREEIFGPVLSTIGFDRRGGGDPDRQRHDLRSRGGGLDAGRDEGAPVRARAARRASCG